MPQVKLYDNPGCHMRFGDLSSTGQEVSVDDVTLQSWATMISLWDQMQVEMKAARDGAAYPPE